LRKGAGEYVLHCDVSIKGIAYPGFDQKCSAESYCKLQLPLFFTFCDGNNQYQAMSKLYVEPLWYGEHPNAIARQLNLCYIFILK
jgi:hypothetical protein